MATELFDVMRNAEREYFLALQGGNQRVARQAVRHVTDAFGLPEAAAASMLDEFSRQPWHYRLAQRSATV